MDIRSVAESTVALISGDLFQYPRIDEAGNELICSSITRSDHFLHIGNGEDRKPVQVFENLQAVSSASSEAFGDDSSMLLPQRKYPPDAFNGLVAYFRHALQKEREPALPVAGVPDGLQSFVVFRAMLF